MLPPWNATQGLQPSSEQVRPSADGSGRGESHVHLTHVEARESSQPPPAFRTGSAGILAMTGSTEGVELGARAWSSSSLGGAVVGGACRGSLRARAGVSARARPQRRDRNEGCGIRKERAVSVRCGSCGHRRPLSIVDHRAVASSDVRSRPSSLDGNLRRSSRTRIPSVVRHPQDFAARRAQPTGGGYGPDSLPSGAVLRRESGGDVDDRWVRGTLRPLSRRSHPNVWRPSALTTTLCSTDREAAGTHIEFWS